MGDDNYGDHIAAIEKLASEKAGILVHLDKRCRGTRYALAATHSERQEKET